MSAIQRCTRQFAKSDPRKWVRHAAGAKTVCRLVLNDSIAFWALAVSELSMGGVRLVLDIQPPVGCSFQMELHNPTRNFSCRRQARASHTTASIGGVYIVGWVFESDLNYDEIERLL